MRSSMLGHERGVDANVLLEQAGGVCEQIGHICSGQRLAEQKALHFAAADFVVQGIHLFDGFYTFCDQIQLEAFGYPRNGGDDG